MNNENLPENEETSGTDALFAETSDNRNEEAKYDNNASPKVVSQMRTEALFASSAEVYQ